MSEVDVVVGSRNPVKIDAARRAFAHYFDIVNASGVDAESGVPDQPVGDQTYVGARNRARQLMRDGAVSEHPCFFVGIEGGVVEIMGRMMGFGAMCVIDGRGQESLGASPFFSLPPRVVAALRDGDELGVAIDRLTGQRDTKRAGGAIGLFTRGAMDRTSLYVSGLLATLPPFVQPELYREPPPQEVGTAQAGPRDAIAVATDAAHGEIATVAHGEIDTVLETSLYVADLDRATVFYADTLGLRPLLQDERMHVFAVGERQVLLLFLQGASKHLDGDIPGHDGSGQSHVAFTVQPSSLPAWEAQLVRRGVAVESRVTWERGGHSVYFRDPDGHLLELVDGPLWPGIAVRS